MSTGKWHTDRFIPDLRKTECLCENCKRSYWLPKSKAGKYKTCGSVCNMELRNKVKHSRGRKCATCGAEFVPRKYQIDSGLGLYCSQKCNPSWITMHTKEARKQAVDSFVMAIKEGRYTPPAGDKHPHWNGGKEACYKRNMASPEWRMAASVRAKKYHQENPEKARERCQSRARRKYGKLPRGTVKKLYAMQKGKCPVCKCAIDKGYHVDHIYPLSRGGKHEVGNVQLLCPTCNLRKSAKDPIKFMQERGYLL